MRARKQLHVGRRMLASLAVVAATVLPHAAAHMLRTPLSAPPPHRDRARQMRDHRVCQKSLLNSNGGPNA